MALSLGHGRSLMLALMAAACGNGDDLDPNATDGSLPEPVEVRPARPYPVPAGGGVAAGGGAAAPTPPEPTDDDEDETDDPVAGDPNVCRTPNGVSGRPTTLGEAIILMNSLPRPTSLDCFLQALERPLSLYMTSSSLSLQPAPGARSPRTFIVNEPLVMSIVLDGPARIALELGYRTSATRSIKTEILFPIERDVTYGNFFEEVLEGAATRCSACHTAEVQMVSPAFPVDVFESDVIPPYDMFEVDLEALRTEHQSCNATIEPERCSMLSAIFDFGEVVPAPQGISF
jgi:hypothetical protein